MRFATTVIAVLTLITANVVSAQTSHERLKRQVEALQVKVDAAHDAWQYASKAHKAAVDVAKQAEARAILFKINAGNARKQADQDEHRSNVYRPRRL